MSPGEEDPRPTRFRRRLLGFFGLPFLSLIMPLLLLPLISRSGGEGGWVAVGVGQSIGAFASIVAAYGWTLVGPSRVAPLPVLERRRLYGDSLVSRGLVFAIVAPLGALTAAILASEPYRGVAALVAIAFALDALSPAWYCIGIGRPGLIMRFDILPRIVALGLAALVLLAGGPLWAYPALQIAGAFVGTLWFSLRIGRVHEREGSQLRRVLAEMWQDRHAALTLIAAGAYSTTPIGIVGATSPQASTAEFISADRVYRVALYAVQALGNAFQGWVAEDRPRQITGRMRAALTFHAVLGVIGMIGLAVLGTPVTSWILGPDVAATPMTMLFFGVAFLAVSVNTSLGRHVLIPLGEHKAVLASTLVGSAIGVGLMVALSAAFGGTGGAAGLAAGEVAVVGVQAIAFLRLRRRMRHRSED